MSSVDQLKLVSAILESEGHDAAFADVEWAVRRIAELENAIAQHKLKQWGGDGVEVSDDADAALYAHLKL